MEDNDSINIYLKDGGKEKNACFKSPQAYEDWLKEKCLASKEKHIHKILIVGSGRGSVSGRVDYAKNAYGKDEQYNYFLVNYCGTDFGTGTEPDVNENILTLNSQSCGDNYTFVIFENVDYGYSFSPKAIQAGLDLLKPGGLLISSTFPILHPNFSAPVKSALDQKIAQKKISIAINFPGGQILYRGAAENAGGGLGEDPFLLYIYGNFAETENDISFLESHKELIVEFLGIRDKIEEIKFDKLKSIEKNSEIWPFGIKEPTDFMIIKKK